MVNELVARAATVPAEDGEEGFHLSDALAQPPNGLSALADVNMNNDKQVCRPAPRQQ